MQEAPPTGLPEQTEGPHAAGGRRPLVIVAVAVTVALIVSAITFLVLRDGQEPGPSGAAAPLSPKVTGLVTTIPTPTATQPSAVEDLAAFLSAAATMDGQLQDAAAAINAAGPPWTDVDPEVARLVNAAEIEPVARAIPNGLPPDLLQSVVLVYSDLASRRAAMGGFEHNPPSGWLGTLQSELGNGHAAAARFDTDLAATRALAAATPPIAAVPADSRLVAEKLLLIRLVDKDNFCDARGGAVVTSLPEIRWGPVPYEPRADGWIGRPEMPFTAEFRAGIWEVNILAC